MNVNVFKVSLSLATVSLIVRVFTLLPMPVLLFFGLDGTASLALLLSIIIFHFLNYFAVQKLMQYKKEDWGFCFFHSKIETPFKELAYFKFYLGFVWRFILSVSLFSILDYIVLYSDSILSYPLENNVLDSDSFLISDFYPLKIGLYMSVIVLLNCVSIFISWFWLLRFPYGKAKLKIL